jgi:hypothetical protein
LPLKTKDTVAVDMPKASAMFFMDVRFFTMLND